MEIFLNYTFKNGGFKKTKQKVDKYLYLLGEDTKNEEKIFYRPHKRSHVISIHSRMFLDEFIPHLQNRNSHYKPFASSRQHLMNLLEDPFDKNPEFIAPIPEFLHDYKKFKEKLNDKNKLYTTHRIPKRKKVNGKTRYRELNEPEPELKELQTRAKDIIEHILKIHPHDAVHSYTQKRDNVTNARMHRFSKHIVKMDLKDFFPSINPEILYAVLPCFKEFAIINVHEILGLDGKPKVLRYYMLTKQLLDAIIDLATFKNGLPQGSPLSPILSNLVLFHFDHQMNLSCLNRHDYGFILGHAPMGKNQKLSDKSIIYTRYADDLTFSSFTPIMVDNLQQLVKERLDTLYKDSIKLNETKTKYLKSTHRCYITGVKINKDKKATYGHEKKDDMKRELFHLFMDFKDGKGDREHAQETLGRLAYLQKIEPTYAKSLIARYCRKFNVSPSRFYKHFLD